MHKRTNTVPFVGGSFVMSALEYVAHIKTTISAPLTYPNLLKFTSLAMIQIFILIMYNSLLTHTKTRSARDFGHRLSVTISPKYRVFKVSRRIGGLSGYRRHFSARANHKRLVRFGFSGGGNMRVMLIKYIV